MIIPRDKYTLDATARTIRLLDPYHTWTAERIKLIRNLPKQITIYDANNPRNHVSALTPNAQNYDIEITNGLISYVENTAMNDGDTLQIIIDTEVVTSTGGGGGGGSTVTISPLNVLFQEEIAASGTLSTPGLSTVNCTKLNVYIANTGASTSVDITVKGSPTSDLSLYKIIGDKIHLVAADSNGPVISDDDIPGYLWFTVENKDSAHNAIITITIERYIGSYIQTNTTLFSGSTVSYGTPATSEDVDTAASRRVNVYCKQAGTSTNTTFDIFGKSSQSPNIIKKIATCTLGANGMWGCGLLQDVIPGSVYVLVTNLDSIRTATATVLVESFT